MKGIGDFSELKGGVRAMGEFRSSRKGTGRKESRLPSWDLSNLYQDERDPKIQKTLQDANSRARRFQRRHRGKLAGYVKNAKKFLSVLKEHEEIWLLAVRPYHFASLRYAECSTDSERGAFFQQIRTQIVECQNILAFFTSELVKVEKRNLVALTKSQHLKEYKNYLVQLIQSQSHELPEREKQILTELGLTGNGAFIRLYDEEFSSRLFEIQIGKTHKRLPLEKALELLHSGDRSKRRRAAEGFSEGLREDSRRTAFITNTLLQDKAIRDRYRNFSSPEDARHLDNQIDRDTVDALVREVTGSYRDVARYYNFKKKLLGLKSLYDYDRYAPVLKETRKVPFSRAREDVVRAFQQFHPEFGRIGELFFTENWIDAAERPGKRSGAFCSFCTPDTHPFVFMNYSGTGRDVFTLAHELGHAIHAYLMRSQTFLNFDTPLTIAETASVFAELLLFRHLVSKARTPKAKLVLYLHHIENVIATVHRQISMFLFERDLHSARQVGELSIDQINSLWRKRQEEMFQGSVSLSSGYDYWWSYIPHFVHTPFYVYAYSFGQMLALGFLSMYDEAPQQFADRYLQFLAAGNSKSPDELLKPFRVSLKKPEVWRGGVRALREMIRSAEKLADSLS